MIGKRVAILQSNYIPWKGYFDLIHKVDEFVLYDEVQYTKRDWRNRNLVKTPNGLIWLTIPVINNHREKISETVISDPDWAKKHWKTIVLNYGRAPYFKQYKDVFEEFYLSEQSEYLSVINRKAIELVNRILGIGTTITSSADYQLSGDKNDRLINICVEAGASTYLSGPAAKSYIDEASFESKGIKVEWMDYSGYREYPQLFPPFEHGVSILDLIFNTGAEALSFITEK